MIGFVGGTGGAAMLMREMACALVRKRIDTGLVVPAWPSTIPFAEDCRARGLRVHRTRWLQERKSRALSYLDAARVARRFRAPVVHYHPVYWATRQCGGGLASRRIATHDDSRWNG